MSDLEIRQLEIALARDPTDLETRQRLLAAYQRTGLLRPNDLLDLAALGDAGAIALTGKTPDLNSRSKKFYLRCAWIVVLQAFHQIASSTDPVLGPGAELYHLADRLPLEEKWRLGVKKDLSRIFNAIDVFNTLMAQYLEGKISHNDGLPIDYFSLGNTASLRDFYFVFERLGDFIQMTLNRLSNLSEQTGERPAEFDKLDALRSMLNAFSMLAHAITHRVKKDTDDAIYSATVAMAYSQGLNYYRDVNSSRRHLLQLTPEEQSSPALYTGVNTGRGYHQRRAAQLLVACRPLIIRQWLPGYTP